MRKIALAEGLSGLAAYKQRHPETAGYGTQLDLRVFPPKPPGYLDAVAQLVCGWLADDAAAGQTNRQDVAALNTQLGGHGFNPDNHFSKPLGRRARDRLAALFEQQGHTLPDAANTLSKVKKAAKAARSGTLPDALPFGGIGAIRGDTLTIGIQAFMIVQHSGHDYLRLYHGGGEARLRLDHLKAFLDQAGLLSEGTPPFYSYRIVRETGTDPAAAPVLPRDTGSKAAMPTPSPATGESLPVDTGTGAPTDQPETLSQRIARLASTLARPDPVPLPDGRDPLDE